VAVSGCPRLEHPTLKNLPFPSFLISSTSSSCHLHRRAISIISALPLLNSKSPLHHRRHRRRWEATTSSRRSSSRWSAGLLSRRWLSWILHFLSVCQEVATSPRSFGCLGGWFVVASLSLVEASLSFWVAHASSVAWVVVTSSAVVGAFFFLFGRPSWCYVSWCYVGAFFFFLFGRLSHRRPLSGLSSCCLDGRAGATSRGFFGCLKSIDMKSVVASSLLGEASLLFGAVGKVLCSSPRRLALGGCRVRGCRVVDPRGGFTSFWVAGMLKTLLAWSVGLGGFALSFLGEASLLVWAVEQLLGSSPRWSAAWVVVASLPLVEALIPFGWPGS